MPWQATCGVFGFLLLLLFVFYFVHFYFILFYFYFYFLFFETGSQVAQTSLRLAVQPEDALKILIILPSPLQQ